MSDLSFNEKHIFEKLFDRSGYVLNFTDRTFAEFFQDFGVDIELDKYHKNGRSKMKRLRAFWEIEDNLIVGKVLEGLLELANNTDTISEKDYKFAKQHIDRLLGKKNTFESEEKELTENEFLKQEFSNINLSLLKLDF